MVEINDIQLQLALIIALLIAILANLYNLADDGCGMSYSVFRALLFFGINSGALYLVAKFAQ